MRSLGLRRRPHDHSHSPGYRRAVARAGADMGDIDLYGSFSPQAGGVFFASDEVARRTLSIEYDFLLHTLQFLRRLGGRLRPLGRVADVGGGVGVVAAYLAALHGSRATVFDHAPGPLGVGRRWARERGLGRVRFVKTTFAGLAGGRHPGGYDLALFLRCLPPALLTPPSGENSLSIPDGPPPRPHPHLQTGVDAVARLLAPGGIAVLSCVWTGWGIVAMCEAVRRAGLGVDWGLTRCRMIEQDGVSLIGDNYLVVRSGLPHLAKDSRTEALAFLKSALYVGGPAPVAPEKLVAMAEWLNGGEVLLRATGRRAVDGVDSVRLVHRDERLVLEASGPAGPRWGGVDTLSGVMDLLDKAQDVIDGWRAHPGGLRAVRTHRRLARFVEYYRNLNGP